MKPDFSSISPNPSNSLLFDSMEFIGSKRSGRQPRIRFKEEKGWLVLWSQTKRQVQQTHCCSFIQWDIVSNRQGVPLELLNECFVFFSLGFLKETLFFLFVRRDDQSKKERRFSFKTGRNSSTTWPDRQRQIARSLLLPCLWPSWTIWEEFQTRKHWGRKLENGSKRNSRWNNFQRWLRRLALVTVSWCTLGALELEE